MREATRVAHDTLDRSVSSIGWGSETAYTRFLQMQYAARRPIEIWVANSCPPTISPPAQTTLIAQDIEALGAIVLAPAKSFSLPFHASPIGAAWALSGSSLGNQVIARSVIKQHGDKLPLRFLSAETMVEFWKALIPSLDCVPTEDEINRASDAALAVFDHFLETIDVMRDRAAS